MKSHTLNAVHMVSVIIAVIGTAVAGLASWSAIATNQRNLELFG